MSFTKHSNFNPKANFSEVKFGENMPVLEVELNEMQQIQNEARADVVRDSIPSGFVTLGEIDYDYCKSNDNQIKLKTESVAYVNGYRIVIPKDTIIEIGESDKEREDLVFLEVWKEAVNDVDTLTEHGGENNAVINNPIKDSRYPVATSQRVALKYRIRHVADLDFNKKWTSGTSSIHPYIGWNNTNSFSNVYAIGGDETITKPTSVGAYKLFRCATYDESSYPKFSDDSGLWVAGRNDETSFEYFKNACIDGYVYAIPMFRLLRKPNVGLASPFEYKKIHTQIGPKKFAHLVGQENVEKVHSVNVKGRTLHNLHHTKYARGKYTLNASNSNWYSNYVSEDGRVAFDITNTGDSGWKYIHLGSLNFQLLKPSTKYLVIFEDVIVPSYINISFKTQMDTELVSSYGKLSSGMDRVTITTTSEMIEANQILYAYVSTEKMGHFELKNVAIYEYVNGMENWDKSMFSFEPGIKSLGELDNNSITVENNLVEEGTYVHELQNHILPTHPEVTHVTWGEDVVIPPEVEIELKRGEEVIQTITQLPVKLETTGEEKLYVKTMKGRTLINAQPVKTPGLAISEAGVYEYTSSENYIKIKYLGGSIQWKYIDFKLPNYSLLKPNTKYLVMFEEAKNITNVQLLSGNASKRCSTLGTMENNWCTFTTNELTDTNGVGVYVSFTDNGVVGTEIIAKNPMIIEYQEGMENWGLKYFTGMKSVEAPSIKLIGKNLFNLKEASQEWGGAFISTTGGNTITFTPNSSNSAGLNATFEFANNITLKAGTKLAYSQVCVGKLSCNFTGSINNSLVLIYKDGTTDTVFLPDITSQSYNQVLSTTFTVSKDCVQIKTSPIMYAVNGLTHPIVVDYQLEVSDVTTTHEPYKTNTFSTPENIKLRGIGDVQDELNLLTGEVTECIDEIVLDGSENWIQHINTTSDVLWAYSPLQHGGSNGAESLLCDKLQVAVGINAIYLSGQNIMLQLNKNDFNISDVYTLKTYLQQNPLTVQYLLATPITKKIGLSEDDYVGKSKVTYQLAEPLRKVGTYSDFIKGDTLFSNIGVEVLNGSEEWVRQTGTDYGFYVSHPNSMPNTLLISPQLPTLNGWEGYARKGIFRGSGAIGLVVSADDLSENTLQGFKNWLQDNPVTIYYVKANPVEIPLKEVSPLECDFSLYRQFDSKYIGYPMELPNGVKDVVIGKGIIKRYTRHLRFDGTESWNALSTDGDVVRAFVNVTTSENLKPKAISVVLNSYKLPFGTSSITREEIGVDQNSNIVLALAKSRLSSADLSGFKNYLGQNPIQVILELNSPYQNTVTEDKCKPIPYMPLNSYVGSLYVADGINQTKFLTAFSPSEYEVQTSNRYYSNEYNLFEDIAPKKSPYGHKTVPVRITDNLHDGELYTNTGFVLNEGSYETATDWVASKNLISVVSGKTYHIKLEANDSDISSNRRYIYLYKYDSNGNYLNSRIDLGIGTQFTPDFTGKVLIVIKTKNVTHIQVTEDKAYTENIPYVIGEKFTAGLEKHEIEDLRHKVSLTGFDYSQLLQDSFLKLIKGELS